MAQFSGDPATELSNGVGFAWLVSMYDLGRTDVRVELDTVALRKKDLLPCVTTEVKTARRSLCYFVSVTLRMEIEAEVTFNLI